VPSLRFVYDGPLGNLQITVNLRHWCKSISVLPVAERTRPYISTSPVNVHEAHEYMRAIQPMQYEFVLHCCDVIALYTASQISNNIQRQITGKWYKIEL